MIPVTSAEHRLNSTYTDISAYSRYDIRNLDGSITKDIPLPKPAPSLSFSDESARWEITVTAHTISTPDALRTGYFRLVREGTAAGSISGKDRTFKSPGGWSYTSGVIGENDNIHNLIVNTSINDPNYSSTLNQNGSANNTSERMTDCLSAFYSGDPNWSDECE
ncbi:MAG: hypothetical protein AAFV53_18840 [Myxococcota bacterium]